MCVNVDVFLCVFYGEGGRLSSVSGQCVGTCSRVSVMIFKYVFLLENVGSYNLNLNLSLSQFKKYIAYCNQA